jgi:hypothetical protein
MGIHPSIHQISPMQPTPERQEFECKSLPSENRCCFPSIQLQVKDHRDVLGSISLSSCSPLTREPLPPHITKSSIHSQNSPHYSPSPPTNPTSHHPPKRIHIKLPPPPLRLHNLPHPHPLPLLLLPPCLLQKQLIVVILIFAHTGHGRGCGFRVAGRGML